MKQSVPILWVILGGYQELLYFPVYWLVPPSGRVIVLWLPSSDVVPSLLLRSSPLYLALFGKSKNLLANITVKDGFVRVDKLQGCKRYDGVPSTIVVAVLSQCTNKILATTFFSSHS